jgi:YfiH family protein
MAQSNVAMVSGGSPGRVVVADELAYLTFERLGRQARLRQGFSLRQGAAANAEEMDFVSRQPERAECSRRRFCRALGFDPDRLVCTQQVHGARIAVVTAPAQSVLATDGLCTDVPEVPLLLLGADCPLVVVFDPTRPAVGAAHAGWRGTVKRITALLVRQMVERYGARPGELLAGIGPAICGRCYEVGPEVVQEVTEHLHQAGQYLRPSRTSDVPGDARWRLDLMEANRRQLLEAGVPAEHIEVSSLCTRERDDWFHSYRRDGATAGRNGLLVGLV